MKPVLAERFPAVSCRDQLAAFRSSRQVPRGIFLRFERTPGADVYNPSVPFVIGGETIIAARVQGRGDARSETRFFVPSDEGWRARPGSPVLTLEDPAVTFRGGELLLAGVRVIRREGVIASWVTDFYRGNRLESLSRFAHGPAHMKDIRLAELPGGRIALFSRPQGASMVARYGWLARIGFVVLDSLEDLDPGRIENAPVLEGHFLPNEWGGCNQALPLRNGLIGAIGHKAYGEMIDGEHVLHYHAMAFAIDPRTRWMTDCRIICTRDCFPDGPAREPRLRDVLFPAGIERNRDGSATLYAGVSDCSVGRVEIPDPFSDIETLEASPEA
jgi:hypothetical protein